jgi:colanic acid biosynthesis glycosyl transferase WcaI
MRVHLHDFSGHPFQAQLSRHLASRGHDVVHGFSSQYITGRGRLETTPDDPDTLRFVGITADVPMIKYSPVGRARFERAYAKAWQQRLDNEAYDVVVACNVPLFALASMHRYFTRRRQPWVLWHQDVYSMGVGGEAARRLPGPVAAVVRNQVERIEAVQVRQADQVVAIGDGFLTQYERWGISRDGMHVIPNWAPLDDLVPGVRDNAWAARHGLPAEPVRIVYAGTLGRKHNPLLLLELLDAVRGRGIDAHLLVISEGVGADDLAAAAGDRPDVRIMGYQPAEDLSDVLASADVLVAILEPDAAQFSVPSKVLSYLSAGRPIIALVPDGNPSATDVLAAGGCVAEPNAAGARASAEWLAAQAAQTGSLQKLGARARALAEERFDIDRIGERFEDILHRAARSVVVPSRSVQLASTGEG